MPNYLVLVPEASACVAALADPSPSQASTAAPDLRAQDTEPLPASVPPHPLPAQLPSSTLHPQMDWGERPWKLSWRDPESLDAHGMPQTKQCVTACPMLSPELWFQREDLRPLLRETVSPLSCWVVLRCGSGKIAGKVVGGPRAKYNEGITGSAFHLSLCPAPPSHAAPASHHPPPGREACSAPTTSEAT